MNRIKQLREEMKMSQNELAQKLNKTQQMVSLYENGTYELDLEGYLILSKLFNCSIEYIAGKSDKRNNSNNMKIEDIYMHLAKEAQELNLDKEDVELIINLYKKRKK